MVRCDAVRCDAVWCDAVYLMLLAVHLLHCKHCMHRYTLAAERSMPVEISTQLNTGLTFTSTPLYVMANPLKMKADCWWSMERGQEGGYVCVCETGVYISVY